MEGRTGKKDRQSIQQSEREKGGKEQGSKKSEERPNCDHEGVENKDLSKDEKDCTINNIANTKDSHDTFADDLSVAGPSNDPKYTTTSVR